jgi:hypothetical protein
VANQVGGADQLSRPGAAAEAAKAAPLEPPARELLRAEHSPKQYLDALDKAGHLPDAARFMAFALPRREAVWWAAQCVRQVPALTADEKAAAALAAAEAWADDPTDDRRRAAFAAAEAAGFDQPAACAALAAFLTEGSMAPAHLQPVPAPSHAGPAAAATAVVLAALIVEPEKGDEKFRKFLALGYEVGTGANRWKEARPARESAPVAPGPRVPAGSPARPTSPPPPPPGRSWY